MKIKTIHVFYTLSNGERIIYRRKCNFYEILNQVLAFLKTILALLGQI